MTLILSIVALLVVVGLVFLLLAERYDSGYAEFFAIVCLGSSALALLVLLLNAPTWIGASYKADIVNREYGTTYTQAEMFYAGEVIDVVRELDRKRYELPVNKGEPAP